MMYMSKSRNAHIFIYLYISLGIFTTITVKVLTKFCRFVCYSVGFSSGFKKYMCYYYINMICTTFIKKLLAVGFGFTLFTC